MTSPLQRSAPEEQALDGYEFRQDYQFSIDREKRFRHLAAIALCASDFGCLYQALAHARHRLNCPPPGRLYTVDDIRMHLLETGGGGPSILLETGLGGMSSAWGWIQPELARFCRVVSYDRAGLGWSEASSQPYTAQRVVGRVRSLLRAAGIPGPYILVGHSMGIGNGNAVQCSAVGNLPRGGRDLVLESRGHRILITGVLNGKCVPEGIARLREARFWSRAIPRLPRCPLRLKTSKRTPISSKEQPPVCLSVRWWVSRLEIRKARWNERIIA